MLFLLNTVLVEVDAPEAHLRKRWRALGCREPGLLRAQEAMAFVVTKVSQAFQLSPILPDELAEDLAALVIAKTGANCLTFRPSAKGNLEPRLSHVPELVLETYRSGAANDGVTPIVAFGAQTA